MDQKFQLKHKQWMNRGKKKNHIYMLPTRDSFQVKGHTETERERIGEDIPCNWK